MHKSKLLISTLMSAGIMLGVTSCTGGDDPQELPVIPQKMVATYAPSMSDIPVPNDLVFKDTQDLTLNFTDSDDYSNPLVALSALDGWSAIAPISIAFKALDNAALTLDPATVVGGTSVHVYKVNTDRPEVDPVNAPGVIAPTGFVTGVERELVAGQEYVVMATSGTSIVIMPTVPFEQQAGYMVILTSDLLDSNGNAITADLQYEVSKSQTALAPTHSFAALEPVRQYVNAMEGAADAAGVPRSTIIQSFQFTIQSIGTVMNTAKMVYIDYPLSLGAVPATSFSSLMTDTTPFTGLGAADLYKGSLTLNYMLGIFSAGDPLAPLNTFWKATTPTGDPSPLGINLSYANPLPKINGQETVPLFVSMPKAALGCAKPDAGYPVAIFQHGITSNRTAAVAIADSLAAPPSCTAVVAMDQPIHGIDENNPLHLGLQAASGGLIGLFEGYTAGGVRERTFGVDYLDNTTGAPGSDGIADSSGAHTMNFANLLVGRDNLRQAIFDLLSLEKAIPFMDIDSDDQADFDVNKISFIGHSLGGIVGTGFIGYSDYIKAAALVNPGGGVPYFLNESPAFKDTLQGAVAAGAGIAVSDPTFPATMAQFLFGAQTVLDSADPINTAAHALTNDVPTLVLQNLGDTVVPNSVSHPLSGTEPLARVLELTIVATDTSGLVTGNRQFSKLNQGTHGSVLVPDAVTAEMQTQIVSFLNSAGAALMVLDPTLLDD